MAQPRRDLDLAEKAVGAYGVSELRIEHLERDLAAVANVLGEIDRRHPAAADLAFDPITAADRGDERGDSVRRALSERHGDRLACGAGI